MRDDRSVSFGRVVLSERLVKMVGPAGTCWFRLSEVCCVGPAAVEPDVDDRKICLVTTTGGSVYYIYADDPQLMALIGGAE